MRRYKALDMVPLAEGEIHVKDYHCSELSFPNSAGFLRVTNMRLIFFGFPVGGVSLAKSIWREITGSNKHTKIALDFTPIKVNTASARLVNETYLEGVNSVSSFYGKKVLLIPYIFAWLFGISALGWFIPAFFAADSSMKYLPTAQSILLVIVMTLGLMAHVWLAFIIGMLSFRNVFSLQIFGASAHDPIAIGEGYRTLLGADKVYSITARPSEHTDEMMLELGTLITDLKRMGDKRAIEKWQAIWESREKSAYDDMVSREKASYEDMVNTLIKGLTFPVANANTLRKNGGNDFIIRYRTQFKDRSVEALVERIDKIPSDILADETAFRSYFLNHSDINGKKLL